MATMGVEPLFLDTNILIRATLDTAPLHEEARHTIEHHYNAGAELWISRQVLREYVAVLSRPQSYSQPIASATLSDDVRRFESRFRVADEDARVTQHLLMLIQQIPVGGRQVHDANLVATMLIYGIRQILTHNVDDFTRFARFITIIALTSSDTDR